MDNYTNLLTHMDEVINWARNKEHLKISDFISVFLQMIRHTLNEYRIRGRDVNCVITPERELKFIMIRHPYKEGLNHYINSVLYNYNNTNLSFIGNPEEKEFSIENIKNFKF